MAPFTIRIPARPTNASDNSSEKRKSPTAPSNLRPIPEGKENIPAPFVPSAGWLRNPAWVDGGVNPPRFYTSAAEIQDVIQAAANAGITVPRTQNPAQGTQAQAADVPNGEHVPAMPAAPNSNAVIGAKAVEGIAPTVTVAIADTPLENAGHLVYVTHSFSVVDESRAARGAKTAPKKKPTTTTKFEYIKMDGISRTEFVKAFLAVHDLQSQYSPGVHTGPDFKLWWTGSNGGKAGALTIENDREFTLALGALMQKNRRNCAVSVDFDTENMDGYRIRKGQVSMLTDENGLAELMYGTRVPQIASFSSEAQLHGPIILQLKNKWVCQQHLGEHGEPGHCYITSNADHIGLNARKLKFWASAIAAHDATKHEPPNTLEFDGARDGRLTTTRPRGRSGPHPTASPSAASPQSDTSQLLMAAILTNLNNNGKRGRSPSLQMPRTPTRSRMYTVPLSPPPKPGLELRACLEDFANAKGVDLTGCEVALASVDFTPDIIPEVLVCRLCELTGAMEGHIMKLQVFCKAWVARFEEKQAYLTEKRRRLDLDT